jgi:hypothetical protein
LNIEKNEEMSLTQTLPAVVTSEKGREEHFQSEALLLEKEMRTNLVTVGDGVEQRSTVDSAEDAMRIFRF